MVTKAALDDPVLAARLKGIGILSREDAIDYCAVVESNELQLLFNSNIAFFGSFVLKTAVPATKRVAPEPTASLAVV